jgi:hypothetical protein
MEEKKPESPDTFAICKSCNEKKIRNPAGKFPNGRDKRYIDAAGSQWVGMTCSQCQASKMRNHQKIKRSKDLQ